MIGTPSTLNVWTNHPMISGICHQIAQQPPTFAETLQLVELTTVMHMAFCLLRVDEDKHEDLCGAFLNEHLHSFQTISRQPPTFAETLEVIDEMTVQGLATYLRHKRARNEPTYWDSEVTRGFLHLIY